jgi:hypothetical protein
MPGTISLTGRQTALLQRAAGNNGLVHIGEWMDPADRKAADALTRCGILSPGSGLHGYSARHMTAHGVRVFAALNLTPTVLPEED